MIRQPPRPERDRWQPLRSGLVDLFYYDAEEFWFRDGRLLLRGNNGTGKSKVLALMLPFLLDGDLSAHRVEPDADPKKRMEWNLLLGGAHPHPECIGYTWLEFGRVGDDGIEQYLTIGCGLKAVAGKGIAAHWFFVTPQRVGTELHLIDPHGSPLSKDRLGDALGDDGRRFEKAREYRRAVDEALFGFGEQRYGALVDLLIQLRQPQLSKRPTEKSLSAALTESLPPLGQAILADVAEAFRSLQEDRDELADMSEALRGAESFLSHYRGYARAATRRKASAPRRAHSRYEQAGRDLGEAERALEAAGAMLDEIRSVLATLDEHRVALTEHQRALHDSAAMDAARELDQARRTADDLASAAAALNSNFLTQGDVVAERVHRDDAAAAAATAAAANLAERRSTASDDAVRAAVSDRHRDEVDNYLDGEPDLPELRRAAATLVDRQQAAIRHVRALITRVAEAMREVGTARSRLIDLDARAAELSERELAAHADVDSEAVALVGRARECLSAAQELRLVDLADVLDELASWSRSLVGDSPVAIAAGQHANRVIELLSRADAAAESTEMSLRAQIGELEAEVSRLESGETEAPPAPHTRTVDDRSTRRGAPLWQVIEYAPGLAPQAQAGIEAALEAAGILDAWVTPAGELLGVDTEDVMLVAGKRATGRRLSSVLRPAINQDDARAASLDVAIVAGILDAIGYGDDSQSQTWVGADGRFRIGVLEGAWHKLRARYIGAGAREQARQLRLAELRSEMATAEGQLGEVVGQRRALADRRSVLGDELSSLPDDSDLRSAHQVVSSLVHQQRELAADRMSAMASIDVATARHADVQDQLIRDAADSGLPAEGEQLGRIADALVDYRVATGELWSAIAAQRGAAARSAEARRDLDEARIRQANLADSAAQSRRQATGAAQRLETLRASVGAEVAELERKLKGVAAELATNRTEVTAASGKLEETIRQRGIAEGHFERFAVELETAKAERLVAVESLQRFARTGLLHVALVDTAIPDFDQP